MIKIQKRQSKASAGDLEIVSLTDMKAYLLEYNDDRDDTITALIESCTADLEAELDFAIDTSGFITQYYDGFDIKIPIWHRYIKSDTADIVVEYLNDSHAWTPVVNTTYRLDPTSALPTVILKTGNTWPTPVAEPSCVRVQFKANTDHKAWASFRKVIQEMVAEAYENPEGSWRSSTMESAVRRVVHIYRMRA